MLRGLAAFPDSGTQVAGRKPGGRNCKFARAVLGSEPAARAVIAEFADLLNKGPKAFPTELKRAGSLQNVGDRPGGDGDSLAGKATGSPEHVKIAGRQN